MPSDPLPPSFTARRSLRVADMGAVCTALPDDFVVVMRDETTGAWSLVDVEPRDPGGRSADTRPALALLDDSNRDMLTQSCGAAKRDREPVRFLAEYVAADRPRVLDAMVIPIFADNQADLCCYFIFTARDVASDYYRLVVSEDAMPGMAGELAAGLARDEFEIYYQPVFEVRSGRMVGAEALVRWNHPRRGVLCAKEFIPVAERAGLIHDLGEWVMWEACAEAAIWNRRSDSRVMLTVNVSPVQVHSGSALRSITASLAASGLDPALLTVDVRAGVLIGDDGNLPALLAHLAALGVSVAIDDFGLDYRALLAIREMSGRTIKIDRLLIAGVDEDPVAHQTLTDLVAAYKPLDLVFTAEGVETEAELDVIRRLGFDYAQGYGHAPPMTAEDFNRYLERASEMPLH